MYRTFTSIRECNIFYLFRPWLYFWIICKKKSYDIHFLSVLAWGSSNVASNFVYTKMTKCLLLKFNFGSQSITNRLMPQKALLS